jgi:predicted phosphodiesterase
VHALRDALAQIERLGCAEIVCAGDLLDYGRFPERTIALLQERRVPTIRGNHDRWAVAEGHDTSGWDLTTKAIEFLESLPASWTRRIDDVRVAVWHARPKSDMKGIYPDASTTELASQLDRAEADVLVVGHTHVPFARFVDRRLVCNPGALLRDPAQPMDGAMLFDPVVAKNGCLADCVALRTRRMLHPRRGTGGRSETAPRRAAVAAQGRPAQVLAALHRWQDTHPRFSSWASPTSPRRGSIRGDS